MDAAYENIFEDQTCEPESAYDLDAWFLVTGDTDDFIFYGEPDKKHSEK